MRFADLRIVKANRGERRIGGPETEGGPGPPAGARQGLGHAGPVRGAGHSHGVLKGPEQPQGGAVIGRAQAAAIA